MCAHVRWRRRWRELRLHELLVLHQLLTALPDGDLGWVQGHRARMDHLRPLSRRDRRPDLRPADDGWLCESRPETCLRVPSHEARIVGVLAPRSPGALAPVSVTMRGCIGASASWFQSFRTTVQCW